MSYKISVRNDFLDFLKGGAIILVVLGHHLQGAYPVFDGNIWFRLVYSFHMPLFMFVSGWAASIGFRKQHALVQADAVLELDRASRTLFKKARRLLLPFCSWGAVMYFSRPSYAVMPAVDYMVLLFRNADNGLWFLPALFFCYVFAQLAWLVYVSLNKLSKSRFPLVFMLISVVISFSLLILSPGFLGLTFAKTYFLYFLAGLFWGFFELKRLPAAFHEAPYLLFLFLFPLWHRTESSAIFSHIFGLLHVPNPQLVLNLLVGGSGIYVFLQVVSRIYESSIAWVTVTIKYIGSRTMEIYVAHFFFLGVFGGLFNIIFPIVASLAVSVVLRSSGLLNFVFLGERLTIRLNR
ncbi:MAG: hypothetical protein H6R17_287 [Proteobacteria bacterium]|nr:hypothetical protein [Pseudomonadota bacterium]